MKAHNKRDTELLELSIQRWDYYAQGLVTTEEFQDIECPLCNQYQNLYDDYDYDEDCENCPIYEFTGRTYCYGTPCRDWVHAVRALRNTELLGWGLLGETARRGNLYDAIEAEIEFLVSLLPETHKWRKYQTTIDSQWLVEKGRWDKTVNEFVDRSTEEFVRVIKMEITGGEEPILRFIGGPTGHESYYISDLLEGDDDREGKLCICGGTINRWPACFVDRQTVLTFIKERPQ